VNDLTARNEANTMRLLADALAAPAPLDAHTLDVAEQTIRDLIKKTHWASDAARLREAANAVHNLLPERPQS